MQLCLHQLVELVSESYYDKVALACANTAVKFGELNSLANRLARALVQRDIGNGDLVGVALERSIDLVAVLLAISKTGAAYVPIDPTLPAERIKQIMDDVCPKVLIIGVNTPETFSFWRAVCLTVGELLHKTLGSDSSNLGSVVRSNYLAYVMYTSGSTGRPKGVEISHGNVSNLLLSMKKEPGCDETDRLLAITTVSFDMAVLELFLPLICGATTVIAQGHEVTDMTVLAKLMERHQVTIMQGTPTIWQMLLDSGWQGKPRLTKILCGGEALSRQLADRLLACGDMMWNMYGPTEATVYASIWRVCRDHDVIIGNAIDNCHLYVLDANLLPVPLGCSGELYIGGAGVARGYRNNSGLTRYRFLDNPFDTGLMYRTGDLARFLAPEKLSLLGRIDDQVKIRGYRIELGDIETAITEFEGISGAVVICRDGRLVAYCIRKRISKSGVVVPETTLDRVLRPWLAERLPAYMMPAFFVEMESFPVSINGKIDRKALPEPTTALQALADTAPASELETDILAIWSRVLGHNRINVDDNFFDIGGDSARVVRVKTELERLLGQPVSSPKLFEYYTIKSLAAYLNSSSHIAAPKSVSNRGLGKSAEDIAIISMACRLPGGISSPKDFWKLLERGGDVITDVPNDRWNTGALNGMSSNAHVSFCRRGGFIPSIHSFDISLFGISPREADALDPSQYMMLETCWEGFERAGYTMGQLRDSQTGVFIGTSNILAHQRFNPSTIRNLGDLDGYTVTGSAGATMSGRISYQLGLQGPAMTIDTACSSSLVTTHLACAALREGECDLAVSGGVSLMTNPGLHAEFSRLHGMSPDGRCRSFSNDSEGTGWSEGSAVVVLKRLSDAQKDGDLVHAIIRGTAVNHDGRSASLTTPSGAAQQRLIHKALATARLEPADIDYIEAHGTGTKLGDPIEATALSQVFSASRDGEEPLWIGSAKSNIGHTQAAAGLVGVLKVILAMQNGILPQTLHVTEPTLAVDWQSARMLPVLNKRPWISRGSRPRRAGVSAFGIGGTNAHVIVEEPPKPTKVASDENSTVRLPSITPFLVSGHTEPALRIQAERLYKHIHSQVHQDNLANLAYSLATTRSHFRKRVALMAEGKTELLAKLSSICRPDSDALQPNHAAEVPKVAMVFTGQGSQWPGMGRDLSMIYPVFREAISEVASKFTELKLPLLDVMWATPNSTDATQLNRTDYAQPALFALEVALWRLWQSWGVKPDFIFGHSLGEVAAAHVAGILDLPDACRLVAARGQLMQAQSGNTKMVSLEVSATEVTTTIEQLGFTDSVDVALYNTPMQTVISGDSDDIDKVANYFASHGRKTKTLIVGHAFHSRHMDSMLPDFRSVVNTLSFNTSQLNVISSLDGKLAKKGQLQQAEYWVKQVREPVRFNDGVQTLAHQHGVSVFLEVGPQSVLCGMGEACLADDDRTNFVTWLPSLASHKNGTLTLQRSVVELFLRRVPIDWLAYFRPFGCQRVEIPTYAFQRDYTVRHDTDLCTSINSDSNATSHMEQGGRDRFQFEIVWHPLKIEEVHFNAAWGLLRPSKSTTWTSRVVAALSRAGVQPIEVEHLKDGENLDGLLYVWDSDSDVMSQAQDFITEALKQLQTAVCIQFMPQLVWITHSAVGSGAESEDKDMRLGGAPLWGLMRTARNEHPELHLRLVDLEDDPGTSIASALSLNAEPECAVRQDQVLVPRLQRFNASPKPFVKRLVRSDGAVLVTGGLGNLGSRIAKYLTRAYGVRDLVLTSRRGTQASGADALVAELSKLGAKVTVIAGNIASPECVKSIMAIFGKDRPLRGVVHAAGVVDSGVLSTMTPERCATTFEPKVYGAWLLHQATQKMDMDFFFMFSSISGIMGMPGLANYAAANTFLDALAYSRRAHYLPATSVAYGTWMGDGMASKLTGTTQAHLVHFGLDLLTPEDALELFEHAVASTRALTVAAALDLERLQNYFEEQGCIPPFLRSLLTRDATHDDTRTPRSRNMRQILNEVDHEQHAGIMLNSIRKVVAKTLGFANTLLIDVDCPLQNIGIDSLAAVQIRNSLATLTGLTLPVDISSNHPNLRALSRSLLSQLQNTHTSSTTEDSSSIASVATYSDSPYLDITTIQKGSLDSSFVFDNVTKDSTRRGECPKSVFLTGATGFVGAFVLHELLKRGITAHCLVRANNVDEAWQRIKSTLEHYNLWVSNTAALINPIVGDIAQPLLGLTKDVFDDLTDRVDTIYHSGALVDWMRPLEDYVGPNTVSTHEVLRLASRGCAKAVHLVSTISTLPIYMGLNLTERDQEYGYATSKYIAERLVTAARWRGARASVYRLPYVTASTITGHFRLDRGDFLHNLVVGSLEMGAFPSLDADMSAVLPIDYLSKTIAAVMTQDLNRIGRDFDFLNTSAPTCNAFFKLIGNASGGKEIVTFSIWKQRALGFAAAHPTSPLARIAAVFDSYTNETAAGMFKSLPVGEHVFGGDDYPAPLLDEQFVHAYLSRINMD